MKRSIFGLAFVALVGAGITASSACSTTDDATATGTTPDGGDGSTSATTTTHITAANGGTVTDPAGKATLTIPPGSLSADTDITLSVSAATSATVTSLYNFGPDGTQFATDKPAVLAINADASLAPSGKSLAVALQSGDSFTSLGGSTYANGVATGNVAHFSTYSVIVVDGVTTLVPPANCAATQTAFHACGGDMTGTWTFADFCINASALGAQLFPDNTCAGQALDVSITPGSDITVDATSFSQTAGTESDTITITEPLACTNHGPDGGTIGDPEPSCTALQQRYQSYTCVDNGSGVCSCTQTTTKAQAAKTSTYTKSGTTFTSTESDGGGVKTYDYCVDHNLLFVKQQGGDGGLSDLVYVLQKK